MKHWLAKGAGCGVGCRGIRLLLVWMAAIIGLSGVVAAEEFLLDDFESATAPAPWTFSNGGEFPGATGSLTAGPGRVGSGARLAYDFTGGGAYVAAYLSLPAPIEGVAVGFWVKSQPVIRVRLRLLDSSGQWLQYAPNRPPNALDPDGWYRLTVPIEAASGWWGGANDGVVHQPIRSVGILAGDAREPAVVGAVAFDDVVLFDALPSPLPLDPQRSPVVAAPSDAGNLAARLGVNIHFTSDDRALDAARSAGIRWVRMDLTWTSVEPQTNVFNWSAFDGLIRSLEAREMKTLFILDYGHPLYTGTSKTGPTNAAQIEGFARYAENAARHFAGHDVVFEIWNEPNISGFWQPAPNPLHYASLTRAVIPRVKQGDPAARILTGGLAGFDFDFARAHLALGGGDGADGVGIHPYAGNSDSMAQNLLYLREIVGRFVTNAPPVWDTEGGYSSTWYGDGHAPENRHTQATHVPRRLLASWAAGSPLMIYYDIRDDGTNPTNAEHNFGLLAHDYSDKPAMQAVRTLTAVASNRVLTGFVPLDLTHLTAVRLDGPSNTVVALWPQSGQEALEVQVPPGALGIDLLGRPLDLATAGDGLRFTLRQTNSPVYLTFPGPGCASPVSLVRTGAVWRYLDTGTNLGTAWVAPDYDDRAWPSGRAPLGYGDPTPATTVSYGPDPNDKFVTTYFRHRFLAMNTHAMRDLWLRLRRDDGAVVYLNGTLVFASNLPGWPAFDALALATLSGADETNYVATWLPPSLLVDGLNVLAVEIHQANRTSSDICFDLALQGTRADLPPTFADLPALWTVAEGDTAALPIQHDGLTPFHYQWWLNSTNRLADQTNASLLLPNAQRSDYGLYHVVVSNAFGAVTSRPAQVLILPAPVVETPLIEGGSVWRYLDDGSDQGAAWRGLSFDDSAWSSGPGKLGSNDNPRTTINIGPSNARYITTWFRHRFLARNTASVTNLAFGLLRDDGAAVYLNGTEQFRMNLPSGPLTHTTRATDTVGGADEDTYFPTNLPPTALRDGINVLAVELHQSSATTSDAGFDLTLLAQAPNPPEPVAVETQRSEGGWIISWPLTGYAFQAETATNLNAPIAWVPLPIPPTTNGALLSVSLELGPAQRFFRLRWP